MKPRIILSTAALALMVVGPAVAEAPEGGCEPAYRLYRNSVAGGAPTGRMHIATFDSCEPAAGGLSYNESNCEIARGLFQEQPGVRVTYWCEPVDLD